MLSIIAAITLISSLAKIVNGYASRMVGSSSRCSKPLAVGYSIMGGGAYLTSGTQSVVVKRNDVILISNSPYIPGETLTISFSDSTSGEYVIDTTKGSFSGSNVGCSNTRFYDNTYSALRVVSLVMPQSGSGDVSLVVGWVNSDAPLMLTNRFTLVEPASEISSIIPSLPPSVPTLVPTFSPIISSSIVPSFKPTISLYVNPTNDVSKTLVTVRQQLENVEEVVFRTNEGQSAFKTAVVISLTNKIQASDVVIVNVIFSSNPAKSRVLSIGKVTVIYTINAPTTVTSELQTTGFLDLFQTNLRTAAMTNDVSGLQLVTVSSAPTFTVNNPTSAPIYAASSSSTVPIVAIAVGCIGGFLLLLAMFCICHKIRYMTNILHQNDSSCRSKISLASGRTEESTGDSTRVYFEY